MEQKIILFYIVFLNEKSNNSPFKIANIETENNFHEISLF